MIDPLTTLQGAYQIAKNMPWRLILELVGVLMIFLLIWALKSSWQETGEWKEKAQRLELDLDIATLAIEQQDKSQSVTDKSVTSADVKKEQVDRKTQALLKQLDDAMAKNKRKCPVTTTVTGVENETIDSPTAGTGIDGLKRVLDTASCEARGKADCSSDNPTP